MKKVLYKEGWGFTFSRIGYVETLDFRGLKLYRRVGDIMTIFGIEFRRNKWTLRS